MKSPIYRNDKLTAIGSTVIASGLMCITMTFFSISILNDYGIILFTLVPAAIGFLSVIIYARSRKRTLKESLAISFLSLGASCVFLLALKIEGLICLVMASPIVVLFVWLGAVIGHGIQKKRKVNNKKLYGINFLLIPLLMTTESEFIGEEGGLVRVTTSIEIDAPIETVWDHVVDFPVIPEPNEWIFKTGIAYPISSTIVGEKEQAIRYCEFTTGAFVEPIEIWQEPHLLQFSVKEQPVPMKHMSDNPVPGNMYKYFVSTKGEFRLYEKTNGRVLLQGTTWYYHKIRPEWYWKIWSKYIIHSIHVRVLKHIKTTSEKINS